MPDRVGNPLSEMRLYFLDVIDLFTKIYDLSHRIYLLRIHVQAKRPFCKERSSGFLGEKIPPV